MEDFLKTLTGTFTLLLFMGISVFINASDAHARPACVQNQNGGYTTLPCDCAGVCEDKCKTACAGLGSTYQSGYRCYLSQDNGGGAMVTVTCGNGRTVSAPVSVPKFKKVPNKRTQTSEL